MDDNGFIFTADATLALIVVIVLTASVTAYNLLPIYQGEDHQHLEALANSILAVMEQDGTLENAAVQAQKDNNTIAANKIINDELKVLVPSGIGYNLTMSVSPNLMVQTYNDSGLYSTDMVTNVKVISAPNKGWMGRAWYKIENFTFVQQPQNVTTTLWNFHNWLTNFPPWQVTSSGGWNPSYYNGLYQQPYWGRGTSAQNIQFSVPAGVTLNNVRYLVGSCNRNNGASYSANVTINNGTTYAANSSQFIFLNNRPSTDPAQRMYNFQGNINTTGLNIGGNNSFYVKFWNMTTNGDVHDRDDRMLYDLPWFSIIANYTTSFLVPQGISSNTCYFSDAAGLAVQDAQDLDGNGVSNEYGRIYNLKTGTVTSFTNQRVVDWSTGFYNRGNPSNGYDDGTPFVITGASGDSGTSVTPTKTAVSTTINVNIPAGNNVLDSFVVVNAYGGVDGALIEVWNGTTWRTIFNSFNVGGVKYSQVSDGYGNIPGIVYIPQGYLASGQNNKVRITVWDDVPGNDYDLVGLTNCYVTTSYSPTQLGIKWDNTPFDNNQSTASTQTQTKSFTVGSDAKLAYLFVGTGMDSRNITVKYSNDSRILYSGSIPYYLDLAALDAKGGFHYITTANSTENNYNLTQGTYSLTVILSSSSNEWESGDLRAEIFSGTRISIVYPQILANAWAIAYSDNATDAMDKAKDELNRTTGYDKSKMSSDALYTGNMPNQIPVRLTLWKQ